MKTIAAQLSVILDNQEIRQNLPLLGKFVLLLVLVVIAFTIGFHVIMEFEGQEHSWITGAYWTLTVMSTLGFGDITFQSDLGRVFSIVVLLTGIVMLLIVLPFAFIRFFYAPWLEAQVKSRVPRELPPDIEGHVIICSRDIVSAALGDWLHSAEIEYVVIEPDPTAASVAHTEGVPVLVGDIDSKSTYIAARAAQARLVVANCDDIINTNIALTVRSACSNVPIAAIASDENAIDILELSGVDHVVPLKRWLGEQLANRINAEQTGLHPVGEYADLKIAELPVYGTPLVDKTVRETRLREETGLSIIGIWDHGEFLPARPETVLTKSSVPVVMGRDEQLHELDYLFEASSGASNPVLVIGGGTVGEAAVRALARKNIPVNLIDSDPARCELLRPLCENVYVGDASNYALVRAAGIDDAPSVLLTTNDDSVNVYLTSYCRRLNPDLRIVSRITSERNLDAMNRAGADFTLSYTTLAVNAITAIVNNRKLAVLGEGVDLFPFPVTPSLYHVSLAESELGAKTGMSVVAIRSGSETVTDFSPSFRFEPGMELLLVGSTAQLEQLHQIFP